MAISESDEDRWLRESSYGYERSNTSSGKKCGGQLSMNLSNMKSQILQFHLKGSNVESMVNQAASGGVVGVARVVEAVAIEMVGWRMDGGRGDWEGCRWMQRFGDTNKFRV